MVEMGFTSSMAVPDLGRDLKSERANLDTKKLPLHKMINFSHQFLKMLEFIEKLPVNPEKLFTLLLKRTFWKANLPHKTIENRQGLAGLIEFLLFLRGPSYS